MDWTLKLICPFSYIVGGGKEKGNLRIAPINFIVMGFISNFDTSFNS